MTSRKSVSGANSGFVVAVCAMVLFVALATAVPLPGQVGTLVAAFVALVSGLASAAISAALYVYVGVFKTADVLGNPDSPVPTAATIALLGVAALRAPRNMEAALRWAVLLLPAVVYLLINSAFAPIPQDAFVKLARLVALGFLPSVLIAIVLDRPLLERLVMALATVGIFMSVPLVLRALGEGVPYEGLTLFNENRIVLGRALAIATVAATASVLIARTTGLRALFAAAAILAADGALVAGSRGALASTIVALAVIYVLPRSRRLVGLAPFALLATVVAGAVLLPQTDVVARYLLVLSPANDLSLVARQLLAEHALDLFGQAPLFGTGLASFSYSTSLATQEVYPHNLVLELLAETGVVGLALVSFPLIVLLIRTLRSLPGWRREPALLAAVALFALQLTTVQVSGDLQINRHLFFFAGIVWVVVQREVEVRRGDDQTAVSAREASWPRSNLQHRRS